MGQTCPHLHPASSMLLQQTESVGYRNGFAQCLEQVLRNTADHGADEAVRVAKDALAKMDHDWPFVMLIDLSGNLQHTTKTKDTP